MNSHGNQSRNSATHGYPMNQGRGMMPGRGRMGGRGRMMMPGRGGPMMQGRGGRGRMMPARGHTGRMGMQGRGGWGRGSRKKVPCKLNVFNRYVTFKFCSYLDRDELEKLASVFPQFTPAPLTPQQQKARMMKQKAAAKKTKEEQSTELKNEGESDVNDDTKRLTNGFDSKSTETGEEISENGSTSLTKEGSAVDDGTTDESYPLSDNGNQEEKNLGEEKDGTNDSKSETGDEDSEKKKKMMKQREEVMRLNMSDCHTLLAQLNTKRLFRRIKYFKRKDPTYDIDKAYPYNKDTVEISELEWEALIEDYKERRVEMQKQKEKEDAEKAERRRRRNRAKKMKKKKKKAEKANGASASVEEGEEAINVGSSQGENQNENRKDSDDDGTDSLSVPDEDSVEDVDFEYVGDKPSKYELLMFTPCPRAVAVLASYPRSGNSLMRNLYEKITLRVTGSDMMGGLQKHDLVGEMATGTNNVQFVKTHYPERMGHPPFRVSRAVLLVRNPYDAMDSYFNLMSTSTHTTSLTAEQRKKYAKLFAEMAKKEVQVWRDFHEFWLKQKIPLLVVRYEDLIRDTVKVISKVIKFVLEINSMTFFEDRIHRAIGEEQVEKLGPYKARSGGIGKSLTKGHYTPQLLNQINLGIMGTMEKFGYKEMMIPNPSSWKLEPLDQHGVFIPGKSKEPMIINQKGLVRGPNRQTNWRMVKMMIEKDKKSDEEKETTPEKVDLL